MMLTVMTSNGFTPSIRKIGDKEALIGLAYGIDIWHIH